MPFRLRFLHPPFPPGRYIPASRFFPPLNVAFLCPRSEEPQDCFPLTDFSLELIHRRAMLPRNRAEFSRPSLFSHIFLHPWLEIQKREDQVPPPPLRGADPPNATSHFPSPFDHLSPPINLICPWDARTLHGHIGMVSSSLKTNPSLTFFFCFSKRSVGFLQKKNNHVSVSQPHPSAPSCPLDRSRPRYSSAPLPNLNFFAPPRPSVSLIFW